MKIQITGYSGTIYVYELLQDIKRNRLLPEPGNYIYAVRTESGLYLPIYVGETHDLHDRLPGHEVNRPALELGVNAVLAHTNYGGAFARQREEEDIIRAWNPPLNKHYSRASMRWRD